jgi:Matrixin
MRRRLGALLAAALLATPARAFVVLGPVWQDGEAPLHIGALVGTRFRGAIADASRDWEADSDFEFRHDFADVGACDRIPSGGGPLTDGAEFDARDCGGARLDFDTLAVTQIEDDGRHFRHMGVVFNGDLAWELYDGAFDPDVPDFGRIALHELGHWLGLAHETRVLAIMAPYASDLDALQSDDAEGARFLYGPSGPPPPPSPPLSLDPERACRLDQLRAGRQLCRKHFGCEAKRAGRPERDPLGQERDACRARATRRFERRFDGAANGACAWTASAAAALPLLADPALAIEAGLLAGADPASRADAKLRRRLLQRVGRGCRDVLAAEVHFVRSGEDARRARERAGARADLAERARDAIERAARAGSSYGGMDPQAAADAVDALVDDWAALAADGE